MLNKISIVLLAAASVVSLCMLPRTGTDAAKLLPAQVLVIAQEDGRITVESDNGASGSGTRHRRRNAQRAQAPRAHLSRRQLILQE